MPTKKTHYVLGFAFSGNRKRVVLIRKLRPAWQCGLLNGVGGHVEPTESPIGAMIREFQEETGCRTTLEHWLHFGVMEGATFIVDCYRTFDTFLVDNAQQKSDEEVHIVEVDYLHTVKYIDNLPWLIHMALDPQNFFMKVTYGET